MKRILAILLAVLVLVSCTACGGTSSEGNSSENNAPSVQRNEDNTFTAYNGGYKLVSCGTKYKSETTIEIPAQYEGVNVVAVGNSAFSGFTKLETIKIPNTVSEIDKRAFENCSSLNNVVIPDSVTIIRGAAFLNCTSLTSISFGSGISAIEGECFKGCTALTGFTVPNGVLPTYIPRGNTSLPSMIVRPLRST